MTRKSLFAALIFFLCTPIYAAELIDIDGNKIPFSSLRGKWVLINYWASWCQPCLNEIRELNRFYERHKKNVALFAVNYDALPLTAQRELINKLRLHYPSLSVDPAAALSLEQLRGVPATFIFNPQGQLSTTLYGGQTLRTLTAAIGNDA